MSYLVDTNVISELVRKKPNPVIMKWFEEVPAESIYLSVLTVGEIRYGIEKLGEGTRKHALMSWLTKDIKAYFESRLLPLDMKVAEQWGQLRFTMKRPLPAIDALIGATAIAHGLSLVTCNTKDFDFPGLSVVDPAL